MANFVDVSVEKNETSFYNMDIDDNSLFDISRVGITVPDKTYCIKRTGSLSHAIEYIYQGREIIETDGKKIIAGAGSCVLIKKKAHFISRSDIAYPVKKSWICFRGKLSDTLFDLYELYNDITVTKLDIKNELEKIYDDSIYNKKTDMTPILFHTIIQKIAASSNGNNKVNTKSSLSSQICDIINEHIFDSISLDNIAASFFMSKVGLIRIFKKDYGCTPYKYFIEKKISIAKELLKNTDMPVKAVGAKLGFNDEHYFSKMFKRCVGISPGQYRKS